MTDQVTSGLKRSASTISLSKSGKRGNKRQAIEAPATNTDNDTAALSPTSPMEGIEETSNPGSSTPAMDEEAIAPESPSKNLTEPASDGELEADTGTPNVTDLIDSDAHPDSPAVEDSEEDAADEPQEEEGKKILPRRKVNKKINYYDEATYQTTPHPSNESPSNPTTTEKDDNGAFNEAEPPSPLSSPDFDKKPGPKNGRKKGASKAAANKNKDKKQPKRLHPAKDKINIAIYELRQTGMDFDKIAANLNASFGQCNAGRDWTRAACDGRFRRNGMQVAKARGEEWNRDWYMHMKEPIDERKIFPDGKPAVKTAAGNNSNDSAVDADDEAEVGGDETEVDFAENDNDNDDNDNGNNNNDDDGNGENYDGNNIENDNDDNDNINDINGQAETEAADDDAITKAREYAAKKAKFMRQVKRAFKKNFVNADFAELFAEMLRDDAKGDVYC